jgi:sugar phosphate isomerase/epimerase
VKLSLSARIAEEPSQKERLTVPFAEVLDVARDAGFQGVCVRGSVVGVRSPVERVAETRRLVDAAGLAVSMVTGDVALAANDEHATDALRDITPYLDLAQALGTTGVRVMLQHERDLPFARRAADEARERGMLLCHQTHTATLCETVDACLAVLERVGRPNFGITYEPANLLAVGDDYGPDQIRRLGRWIFNVYVQNLLPEPDGPLAIRTNRGVVRATPLAVGDRRGVDLDALFEGLRAIGYDGWITLHSARLPGLDPEASARQQQGALARRIAGP